MGRIKTKLVKRVTHKLMETYGDSFTEDFEENKQAVNKLVKTPSLKLRNIIAGYATRLVKKSKEEKTETRYTHYNEDEGRRDSRESEKVHKQFLF